MTPRTLPQRRSYLRLVVPGGYTGRCPVHGGSLWVSDEPTEPQHCGRIMRPLAPACGRVLEITECPVRTHTGYVVGTAKSQTGADLVYLNPHPHGGMSRNAVVVQWDRVLHVGGAG